MYAQEELVDRFMRGAKHGVASNMSIGTTDNDSAVLMGYGHAVYAYIPEHDTYGPVVFAGWKSASKSSAHHINLCLEHDVIEVRGRAKMTDLMGEKSLKYLRGLTNDGVDYSSHHRRSDRR